MTSGRHDFEVVASTPIFDGRVVKLRVDDVRMPGGGTGKREIVGHGGAVAVAALDSRDPDRANVLLIEQYRHAVGRRLWEMPAGLLDVPGEPPQPAAERELLEETGFRADAWSVLLDVATSPGFSEETVRIYLATDLTFVGRPDAQDREDNEEAELRIVLVPLRTAVQAALAGDIVNVMAVAALLAADGVLRGTVRQVDRPDGGDDAPWAVHRGPGTPGAPPLDGSREL